MKEYKERQELTNLIIKALQLNIDNCLFMKQLYKSNKNTIKVFNKSILQSKKALVLIKEIKHIEILRAVYGDVIGQMSGVLMLGGSEICSKQLKIWDKTEKGLKEFLELQEQNQKIMAQKLKERQESAEIMKKAKEQGKKVEMLYDPVAKKVRPVVMEEKNNA